MMNKKISKKMVVAGLGLALAVLVGGAFVPHFLGGKNSVIYQVKKGSDYNDIAKSLKEQGIISNPWMFKLYVLISGSYSKLQAGVYDLSASMSSADIIKKFVYGDTAKTRITIVEGWSSKDISNYLEDKNFCLSEEFLTLTTKNATFSFDFLNKKPKYASLEGYLFPDTYQLPYGATPEDLVKNMLENFDKKLTPELKKAILAQHRSVFEVVTMASILEKEVRSLNDKKMVAGILWKRIANGMPLQVDATINYITKKNNPSAVLADLSIDSPYNTYKYTGLPAGPICNPGLDSITAAIFSTKSPYWYYLSASATGRTIFSKTFEEHSLAIQKYLRY